MSFHREVNLARNNVKPFITDKSLITVGEAKQTLSTVPYIYDFIRISPRTECLISTHSVASVLIIVDKNSGD